MSDLRKEVLKQTKLSQLRESRFKAHMNDYAMRGLITVPGPQPSRGTVKRKASYSNLPSWWS